MNEIVQKILTTRERAGPRAQSRFEFQASASILKTLQVHSTAHDYRVFFDHIDDLIFLDRSSDPDFISIFQIKGWESEACGTSKLCEVDNSRPAPRSIPGRLYWSVKSFTPSSVSEFGVITNAVLRFSVKRRRTSIDTIKVSGSDLADKEWEKISKRITEDFPEEQLLNVREKFVIERLHIDVRGHRDVVRARLWDAMEQRGAIPDVSPISAGCSAIFENVRQKIGEAVEYVINDLESLYSRKSLSRAEFEEFLGRVARTRLFTSRWHYFEAALQLKGMAEIRRARIHALCQSYLLLRAQADHYALEFSGRIRQWTKSNRENLRKEETFMAIVDLANHIEYEGPQSKEDDFSLAARIVEISEADL